jgi:tetratricopeptide (TPR) repeat protein
MEKCPYSTNKLKKFSAFNRDNDTTLDTNLSTQSTKPGMVLDEDESNCPYKQGKIAEADESECPYKTKQAQESKCPYSEEAAESKCPYNNENPEENKDSKPEEEKDEESDDDKPKGGCPVRNTAKKDPVNKHFTLSYELPKFGPYDFLYSLRGLLEDEEFFEKTKKVRRYPRHMKYTLFYQKDEKLQKVHKSEFPRVFFVYDDIKEKGSRFYRKKQYKEAIDHYIYAYGLLKWIEFKDENRGKDFLKNPSLDPILDDDIVEKMVYLDDVKVEEDSFKACVVYTLMHLSYSYMEMRHYTDALDCLDEALEIAEDKVPDLYFRRSQTRTYNSYSSEEELEKAMFDIEKAISLKENPMYEEHKKMLQDIIEKKFTDEVERTRSKIN